MGSRRKYSQEFKLEAVQLAGQAGVSVTQVEVSSGTRDHNAAGASSGCWTGMDSSNTKPPSATFRALIDPP